jgi:hypothetical protein
MKKQSTKSSSKSLRGDYSAFSRYKADPVGPNAGRDLRKAFRSIEEIDDIFLQFKTASKLAEELARIIDNEQNPVLKKIMFRIIEAEVKRLAQESLQQTVLKKIKSHPAGRDDILQKTLQKSVLSHLKQDMDNVDPDQSQSGINRDMHSLQILLQNIYEVNPRFRRLINEGIQVDGVRNGTLRITKKIIAQNQWFRIFKRPVAFMAGILSILILMPYIKGEPKPRRVEVVKTVRVPVKENDPKEGFNEYQRRVTPTDELVDITSRKAIKRKHKGKQNLQQVFDIYDWFVQNISYLSDSHPIIPRMPKQVLKSKDGDCKSMAVALASMLENTGFRTVLLEKTQPPNEGQFHIKSHMYLGIMISADEDEVGRKKAIRKVKKQIKRRYFKKLRRIDSSEYPFEKGYPKLQFRELSISGRPMAFLLLDPTLGPASSPGIVKSNEKKEKAFVSRPDPDIPFIQPFQ